LIYILWQSHTEVEQKVSVKGKRITPPNEACLNIILPNLLVYLS